MWVQNFAQRRIDQHKNASLLMHLLSANQFKVNFAFALSGVVPAGLQNITNGCVRKVDWLQFVLACVIARLAPMTLYTFMGSRFKGLRVTGIHGLYQAVLSRIEHSKQDAQHQKITFGLTALGVFVLICTVVWLSIVEAPRMMKELKDNYDDESSSIDQQERAV